MPRLVHKLAGRIAPFSGWLAFCLHGVALAGLGWYCVQWREILWPRLADEEVDWQEMGMDSLQRFSFDVPFIVRHSLPGFARAAAGPKRPTDEVVILYMDEESGRRLEQAPGSPWSRAMHARLLRVLAQDGARAVLFDVIFDNESPDDAVFAEALANHGQVFLGAAFSTSTEAPLTPEEAQRFLQVGIASEQLTKRNRALYRAARGWGLLTFRPVDSDYGVRRLFVGKPRDGFDPWPAATWQVAQSLGAQLPEHDERRFARRWINYYGPARHIESLSYSRAVVEDGGVPAGYFKDKVVFVGARSQLGSTSRKLLDEFSTPWSRFHARAYTPGVEIHATIFLNLLHHDWLERIPLSREKWFVVLLGVALAALRWLQPRRAVFMAVFSAAAIFTTACLVQWHSRLWWNWSVPVLVQVPLGVGLAVASRYYIEERGRRKLRNAFGFYLSPDLADQIADHDFNLAPGGEKVIATLVFTDLEGFTALSEKLGDSAQLGRVLTDYFTRTTDQILAEKGTVIKFIGDAVFAAWGAPLPQPDHAERAVRAAWRLTQVSAMSVPVTNADGSPAVAEVRTRVGIHTGEALAGNLGSARRFDYTLIGDAVNFAARLEGINKYTGTSILLSDETARLVAGKFLLRRLGSFKVVGKTRREVVHELLGEDPTARPAWVDLFDAGVAAWTRGDSGEAQRCFQAVVTARGGRDGPSQFYLDRLESALSAPAWPTAIELDKK